MNILIRTDSSHDIGSGHLMRCLTLADELRRAGAKIEFACRDLPGNLNRLIDEHGFLLLLLPENLPDQAADAAATQNVLKTANSLDWIIVDQYDLDHTWHTLMRPQTEHIMVIDDMADRHHDCDLLLDQNLYNDYETRYDCLVPDRSLRLLGPQYALLRREFNTARQTLTEPSGRIARLLLFFGGPDPTGETVKAVEAVRMLGRSEIAVEIIIGAANCHREKITDLCADLPNGRLHVQVDNMAELMAHSDLALGAVGSTTWERCCLGLPTIFWATSDNEIELAESCRQLDIGLYLGHHHQVTPASLKKRLVEVLENPQRLREWSQKAAALVDGLGAKRVTRIIVGAIEDNLKNESIEVQHG
ncbi:MAG: UDP-2,4-diacetamido-2,4,6-trideoxy-beta-L-altropyranose hydrolase [FCB group bacterium]|nr:UDP-2,4-diacetamido-2,4,6-trideoxy-beta-L-altropyranose hydrolase [FCB group bacterium]